MNFNDLQLEAFDPERGQWCKIIEIDVERDHIWMSNGFVQFNRDLLSTTIRTPLIKESVQQTTNSASAKIPDDIKEKFKRFVDEQKSLPSSFADVVNKHFWDLV
jgi:hypothetical protein